VLSFCPHFILAKKDYYHNANYLLSLIVSTPSAMVSRYRLAEAIVEDALHAYRERKRENLRVNITQLAKEFKVPYTTLYNRIHGRGSRSTRSRTNLRLDNTQYEALYQYYLGRLDDLGESPTSKMLETAANTLLRRCHTDPQKPPPKVVKN
jgi:helix-turn-helix, Psq domain